MKGTYKIKISNSKVSFSLELERNITIICGNSATGKTTLIEMILDTEKYLYDGKIIKSDVVNFGFGHSGIPLPIAVNLFLTFVRCFREIFFFVLVRQSNSSFS